MALQHLRFTFGPVDGHKSIEKDWSHTGVVGSGDMEILLRPADNGGKVNMVVVTPVKGFDNVWEMVLQKFVLENKLGNLDIEINDNNATPFIAAMRLKQALIEAERGDV